MKKGEAGGGEKNKLLKVVWIFGLKWCGWEIQDIGTLGFHFIHFIFISMEDIGTLTEYIFKVWTFPLHSHTFKIYLILQFSIIQIIKGISHFANFHLIAELDSPFKTHTLLVYKIPVVHRSALNVFWSNYGYICQLGTILHHKEAATKQHIYSVFTAGIN